MNIFGVIIEETKKEKKKKKKKSKKTKPKRAENKTEIEDTNPEPQDIIEDVESEDENNENVDDASSVSIVSNESRDSDSADLQFDGRVKVGPQYPVFIGYVEDKVEKIENEFEEPPKVIKGEVLNLRALHQNAKTYELENFDKNYLMIFNQKNFTTYPPRDGTEKDVEALKATLSKYKFECHEYHDLTKNEIIEQLQIFKNKDFKDYGCVAVAVLTHGNKDGLLRAADREYSEMEIINYFKTHDKPSLVTKPKLLIIQACRGLRLNPAVPVMRSLHHRLDHDVEVEPYTLPAESDMLILHSSYVGCPSVRSEIEGSWFIQTLCKKILELSEELDLESILTEVKREVSIDLHHDLHYNKITDEALIYKQMPVVTSTLIRKLFLKMEKPKHETDSTLDTYLDCPPTQRSSQSEISSLISINGQCVINYFAYIKNCLSYFLDENPDDDTGRSYLEISNTFEDTEAFNTPKEKMAKAICNHLCANATNSDYFKYIYLHQH
ncbi:caspase-3-like [Aricia agestis]|uniref:caspase-3-like n=1 Tax=Aricia agestis TaxID=91739 RepID=UPI001C20B810|nr:caspase-3-like [Aricia agestis]